MDDLLREPLTSLDLRKARRRQYYIYCLQGMNHIEAGLKAGYSESYASNKLPYLKDVKADFRRILESKGVTHDRLAEVIEAGLGANKSKFVGGVLVSEPDHAVRHRFVQTVLEVSDLMPDRKVDGHMTIETHEQRMARLSGEPIPPSPCRLPDSSSDGEVGPDDFIDVGE